MKKKMMAVLLAGMMVLAAGCGSKEGKVTVGEYKGLALTNVSQETVDAEIQTMLEYFAELVDVDREAQPGDTVNIDYVGLLDGVAFEGGTGDAYDLVLGSNTFIEGFEAGLLGAVAGEVRDLNLTFPENYGKEELNGQDVVFNVTVNSVKEEVIPELTDELIKENFDQFTTVAEYTEALKESLNTEAHYEQVTELLMNSSEVEKYNEDAVAVEKQSLIDEYTNYASYYGSMYGLDTETAIQYFLGFESTEAFEKGMESYAYDVIKNEMIIKEIAAIEKIELSEELYDSKINEYSAAYGYEDSAAFVEDYGEDVVRKSLLAELVMEFIIDNAVIADAQ